MNVFQHEFKDTPVTLDIQRSRFLMKPDFKCTFNQGELVPVFLAEVVPGDTFKMDMSAFIRMTTPIYPIMDNSFVDLTFFYCPLRILWDHTREFFGENTTAPWAQTTEYTIPQVDLNNAEVTHSDLIHYLGIPQKSAYGSNCKVNALPLRAYYMIWNEWFRDENLQYPINIYKGDSDVALGASLSNGFYFGKDLLPSNRIADYFSTALPNAQKGNAVKLPLGDRAPVVTSSSFTYQVGETTSSPMKLAFTDHSTVPADSSALYMQRQSSGSTAIGNTGTKTTASGSNSLNVLPVNLFADLQYATAATVNELRQAFAIQRLLERDAMSGTRYREVIKAHFGVGIPDATVQVPEYLGGFRQPINMDQVVQTSSTDNVSPLATTSGVSVTTHTAEDIFTKSFTEFGYVIGLATIRVDHSYSQGIEPLWMRDRRYSFYDPVFANLGNVPIYKYELYAGNNEIEGKAVFGYKECWAELRYMKNRCAGLFAAPVSSSPSPALGSWVYTDIYSSTPALSDAWIREGKSNVQNTLAVQNEDQFLGDFYFKIDAYRPLPLYSVPGLIDHH